MAVATRDWLPTAHEPAPASRPRHLREVPGPRPAPDDHPRLALLVPAPRPAAPVRVLRPAVPACPAHVPGARHFPPTGVRTPVVVPVVLDPALVAPEEPRIAVPGPRRRIPLGAAVLNLLALAGIGMSGLTVYAATHDLRPLVVRSGSMEPLIHTGGMVLVRDVPASALQVGDVVAVKRPDGVTVTHRIVRLSRDGDVAQLVLKGDANRSIDPAPVPVATAGKLVWTAPYVGRVAAWTASAQGGFALGALCASGGLSALRRRRA